MRQAIDAYCAKGARIASKMIIVAGRFTVSGGGQLKDGDTYDAFRVSADGTEFKRGVWEGS